MIISCLEYVDDMKSILKEQVSQLIIPPCLVVIQVGNNAASNTYINNKRKVCEEVGINFVPVRFNESVSEKEVIELIKTFNRRLVVDGIIVQLPLPKHIDVKHIAYAIDRTKDVDGFRFDSLYKPCTPKGIIDWLKFNKIDLSGKSVCVIGRSDIVGRPLVKLLEAEDATIIWCNSKTRDLKKCTKNADIVISAIGKANYFDASYFSEGQIVIDVGINRDEKGKLCGDVREDVSDVVKYKTPVPNGVGKLTVCSLIENVVEAYSQKGGI